ncbi:hypothetical protein IU487_34735 [Nocardia puris]|uniref:hypothetical protein n=1 Tax=Nocardia puris TaxID=208602 RepID=UPI001895601B|nr:hypothetical protein [Nocardia puris]MBF6216153.1 hypothetical protein [Nocardia puris]
MKRDRGHTGAGEILAEPPSRWRIGVTITFVYDHFHDQASGQLRDALGREDVDEVLLSQVLGAGLDQCLTCEETMLALLANSASTTAFLVEIACGAVLDTLGGFPIDLVDTGAAHSSVPITFRRAAAAFARDDRCELEKLCQTASSAQRHAAARTAAALYVGEVRAASARQFDYARASEHGGVGR